MKIIGGAKGAAREFTAYFKDAKTVLKTKLDLSNCTPFEKKVYRMLRRVPAGKVLSYGELAKRAGYPGAARAVGSAMKKNRLPIVIPCHRVISSSGGVGEYSAGKKWKRWLLEHEKR
ncbi:MAG: MGMT family protein [Candidatus Omnitrophota bacterium]